MAESKRIAVHAQPARPQQEEETYVPLVDIYEEPDGTVVLAAEVPGASPEKVDVHVDKGVLTLSADGTMPEPSEKYTRTYTSFVGGKYFRAFALSDEIDREKIDASFTEGLLTIRLPKAAAAKTRKIEIRAG